MKTQQMTNSQIASFSTQMTLILHAGISSYEGISIMCEDHDSDFQEVLETIYQHLDQGDNLYQSLLASQAFPHYFLEMIHIGETAGRLEEVMDALGTHYQRLHDNNENIKSAMTYPFIMIMMMLIVVGVLITQVLPIFNNVFLQLGSQMSGFSKIVLDIGLTLSRYSYIFIGFFIVLMLLYFYLTRRSNGQMKIYNFFSRWKPTRNLILKMALSELTSGMSISLSSGLDVEQSLEMSKELISHQELKKKIETVQQIMQEKDFSTALIEANVLTGMYARLIKLGYKTGGMDSIMRRIADQYDQETNERITHLISIIEPTLVAILSILVGIILLSVMMPLIGIMSSL